MKKIAVLALALAGLFTQATAHAGKEQATKITKEIKIGMDRNGSIVQVIRNDTQIYPQDKAEITGYPPNPALDLSGVRLAVGDDFPKELNSGAMVTLMIFKCQNDKFKITITSKKTKYDLIPIFVGETNPSAKSYRTPSEKDVPPDFKSSFILDESGTSYQVKVTRVGSGSDSSTEIFAESLQTRARYRLGSHIGIFIPYGRSTEYSLGYSNPTDSTLTIKEDKLRSASLIFIGSIYPFGMEPDGALLSCRRIQLNVASELSDSIFKKIYLGLGYDFTYASISLLGRFATVQELRSGFHVGDPLPGGLNSVPTVSKNKIDWGVTICMPMSLMVAWLGKALGL